MQSWRFIWGFLPLRKSMTREIDPMERPQQHQQQQRHGDNATNRPKQESCVADVEKVTRQKDDDSGKDEIEFEGDSTGGWYDEILWLVVGSPESLLATIRGVCLSPGGGSFVTVPTSQKSCMKPTERRQRLATVPFSICRSNV